MRIAPLIVLGATLLAATVGLGQLASAQTPSPTAGPTDTPGPTASPSPTPYPAGSSTITIRFVSNGQPVDLFFLTWPGPFFADGVPCLFPRIEGGGTQFSIKWPLQAGGGQPVECSKGPPTSLTFEFGNLVSEFEWLGGDVTVDLEVPAQTATATPVELPDTGGRGSERPSSSVYAVAALLAALCTLAAAYAMKSGRWR
jgi:hypothetical protein